MPAKHEPLRFDEVSRARRKARERRLKILARTFPALRAALSPADRLDLSTLMEFAEGRAPSTSAFHAARFILAVWSEGDEWNCTPFDVFAAMTVWDEEHREAFLAWPANPWWK